MQYYKWMYEREPKVKRIPGFVFTDLNTALEFKDEFTEWMGPPEGQPETPDLFTFKGVDPTSFPIIFSSDIAGNRHDKKYSPKKLSPQQVKEALMWFGKLPSDYFMGNPGDDVLAYFQDLVWSVGCLMPGGQHKTGHVYDVEAYYAWPTIMTKMNIEDKLNDVLEIPSTPGSIADIKARYWAKKQEPKSKRTCFYQDTNDSCAGCINPLRQNKEKCPLDDVSI